MSYLGHSRSQITARHSLGQQFTDLPGKGKTSQSAEPLQKCHLPPEIAQGCHIALKGTAAPAVLKAQPCAVGCWGAQAGLRKLSVPYEGL